MPEKIKFSDCPFKIDISNSVKAAVFKNVANAGKLKASESFYPTPTAARKF